MPSPSCYPSLCSQYVFSTWNVPISTNSTHTYPTLLFSPHGTHLYLNSETWQKPHQSNVLNVPSCSPHREHSAIAMETRVDSLLRAEEPLSNLTPSGSVLPVTQHLHPQFHRKATFQMYAPNLAPHPATANTSSSRGPPPPIPPCLNQSITAHPSQEPPTSMNPLPNPQHASQIRPIFIEENAQKEEAL
ncbi:hypothetical protein BYT27DRAFT_7260788 [Phlegmacium glaucopus]|nr:hypothetical protein BYT27DRAFT_7260788 [Phlegmacium glaucopus]